MRGLRTLRWGRAAGITAGRVLVLLMTLAGVFAMHGLSDHGSAHHGAMPDSATIASAAAMGMHGAGPAGARVDDVSAVSTQGVEATNGNSRAAMTLCLAVLAGLVLFLFRARRAWFRNVLRSWVKRSSKAFLVRARAPDPPDLFALCIQRC